MDFETIDIVRSRQHAASILAMKLHGYSQANTLIISTDTGGFTIGLAVAANLNLPVRMIPCRAIPDPANCHNSIGSVSGDELILNHTRYSIPKDYIWRQIEMLRRSILHEKILFTPEFDGDDQAFENIVIVQDIISSAEAVAAAIHHLRKANSAKLVIASAVITDDAFRQLSFLADEIIYINKVRISQTNDWFPPVDPQHVYEMFTASKEKPKMVRAR